MISLYTTYQQTYLGVPIHNNFIKIGTDSKGVFSVINRWKVVQTAESKASNSTVRNSYISEASANSAAQAYDSRAGSVQKTTPTYADLNNDGTYTLCYLVEATGGIAYLVDGKTSKVAPA